VLLANGSCLLRRPLRWLVTAWTSLQQWSWPLAVGLLAGLWLLLGTTTELLQDPDTLLHLKIGAWIHSHGAVPHVDVFSHTRYGAPWVAHEWLAACLMAAAYRLGGWTALMVGAVAVFTLTLTGLTRWLLQRLPPIYALLLVALAAAPLSAHLLARPHVLSWPLLLVWTIGLVQAREANNGPSKWLLLVMVVWANLHGSFTLGLLLAGGFALEAVMAAWGDRALLAKQARAWVFFCVLSVGAAMITPYGWQGLGLTLHVTGLTHLQDIAEWAPPSGAGLVPVMLWGTVITALSVLGLLRMPLARWGLLAGLVYQASTASRMGSSWACSRLCSWLVLWAMVCAQKLLPHSKLVAAHLTVTRKLRQASRKWMFFSMTMPDQPLGRRVVWRACAWHSLQWPCMPKVATASRYRCTSARPCKR
jgi:hypothetical protein